LEEGDMIKVLLTRRVRPENSQRVLGLLTDLRAAALRQPGYVTGETVVRGEDPVEVLAIGTWLAEEYWNAWSTSEERIEIEDMIAPLLAGEPRFAVYHTPQEEFSEDAVV
jgi:antibiotic biosynthesis monooxygenase (ABM) superfamily enzyme